MNEDKTNEEKVETTEVEETKSVEQTDATPEKEEEAVEQPQEEVTAEPESKEDEGEEIDLNKYWQERYAAPQNQSNEHNVVAEEMAKLPTDEYGNIDESAAAEWLSKKFNEVQTAAEQRAIEAARNAFHSDIAEMRQQQELLERHPEIKKDKDFLDTIMDLRDAAAIRGENLTLLDAASRVEKIRQNSRSEGVASANKVKTIQAAAHLETASQKGDSRPAQADLSDKAARQALLKQFVTKGIETGEIQIPG